MTEYGYCECGCGGKAPIAPRTYAKRGIFKGQPGRYIFGHQTKGKRGPRIPHIPVNPSGLCMCGCGERTPIAEVTVAALGHYKDEPIRFVRGHNSRLCHPLTGRPALSGDGPNPSGVCLCGCGEATPRAAVSNRTHGNVAGKPLRYVHGHAKRKPLGYEVDEATGCWNAFHSPGSAYAYAGRDGKRILVHRAMYERQGGPIPDGLHVHHVCENTRCVNPAHLEALTPLEHRRRHAQAA